jgi:signal transduction histidine kinase
MLSELRVYATPAEGSESSLRPILGPVLVGVLPPVLGVVLIRLFLPHGHYVNVTLHRVLGALGAFSCLLLAYLALIQQQYQEEYPGYPWMACGLMGMGVLTAYHALAAFENAGVGLRSLATLWGGAFFALVWLPQGTLSARLEGLLPWVAAVASALVGFSALAFPGAWPEMVREGVFTPTAQAINILGGLGFFGAAAFFWRRHGLEASPAYFLFTSFCLLFGSSGMLFRFCGEWTPDWWFWPLLQLLAYLLALLYVGLTFQHAAQLKAVNVSLQGEVSQRRRAEEELRRLNEELEKRVQERTARLEAANRELEGFAYSVSHDLRAPLRAIDGFSRVFLEEYGEKVNAEGERLLNIIRQNTQKMGQLVDDLLAFSQSARQEVQAVALDMDALMKAVIKEQRSLTRGRDLKWVLNPLGRAWGDPALLRQVWVNLLSNALKFTGPRENPVIEVGCRREDREIVYYVQDNGVGFDMKYGHKLFGVFQRLHRQEEFPGTGVGLALVQRIVQRHGGRVWAEGQVDKGATFYFSLPCQGETA